MGKNYKNFDKIYIGCSDIASLTLRSWEMATELDFIEDGCYSAYFVTEAAEIGDHYELVFGCHGWLRIYDDDGKTAEICAKDINVYRAGDFGCIIEAPGGIWRK